MKSPTRRGGFTILELMIVVVIISIVAGLAIPAFMRYMRRAQSSEATMNVRKMYDSSIAYFGTPWAAVNGDLLESRFPVSTGLKPANVPAAEKVETNDWANTATWSALNFGLSDPHRFSYQYDSIGIGNAAQFTASSFGDLDGDGECATFVRHGSVWEMEIRGSSGIYTNLLGE